VSDRENGEGEHLALWLKEAGRRAQPQTQADLPADSDQTYNSPASLHRYVEELAGRKLPSHAEVLEFLKEVAGAQSANHAARERRRMVREVALLAVLAVSYLHYYYWEVQRQIAALGSVRTFIPAAESRGAKRAI
jgi:methyl coenzyme M reductase alpha subunit